MTEVLSYKYPAINPAVSANQESHQSILPVNQGTYRSDQTSVISFNVASNSQFLRTVMSYLSLTITPRAANGDVVVSGTTTNSLQGGSRVISRLVIRAGATVLENISGYDDLVSLYLSQTSGGAQSFYARTEGYGLTNIFQGGARKVCLPIWSSLFVTKQALPLPLFVGGITIDIYLAAASNLFTSSNVSYYTVDSPMLQTVMVTPPASYTVALVSAVRANRSAFIPYVKTQVFRSSGNGSMSQRIVLPIGNFTSVDSIQTVFWDSTAYAVATNDKHQRFSAQNLVDFRLEGAGIQVPQMLKFNYGGQNDPELLMIGLMSKAGSLYEIGDTASVPANWDAASFRIQMNFTSSDETFGSGLNMVGAANPNITLVTTHSAPVATSINISTFVQTSALIELTGTSINVSDVF
ncbi:MAG: hypothetical protein JWO77_3902 [Ilumatobacteraceae bacterium]|nr:hypothetical protein [Ilumatobacteraceae bacterium]MDB5177436.1 hypothetical protein [Candidatus Saccharibacteria bacterium]